MKTRFLIIMMFGIVLASVATVFADDFRITGNPNECWYQEDDGTMTPCKINSTGTSMIIGMGLYIFWPYIVLGIILAIIFIVWRKRK